MLCSFPSPSPTLLAHQVSPSNCLLMQMTQCRCILSVALLHDCMPASICSVMAAKFARASLLCNRCMQPCRMVCSYSLASRVL